MSQEEKGIPKCSSIAQWLENITDDAGRPALLAPGKPMLTYAELKQHIENVSKTLRGFGISRKSRVAVISPNGPEMASAFLSVTSCAAYAPLNSNYKKEEYEFYLTDLKASALLVHCQLDTPAREVAQSKGIPVIEMIPGENKEAGWFELKGKPFAAASTQGVAEPDDTALILYTSGTTSRPKMVPLSQRNIFTSAYNIGATLGLSSDDRCLNLMPLFHIHGLMAALLASLNVCASVVCTPGFKDELFIAWLKEFSPTWYTAVPTIHQAVLQMVEKYPEITNVVNFRLVRSSSSSMPPVVMERLEKTFNIPVIEAYGMTEAAHQMACNPMPPKKRKPGSVGPAAGPELAIMAENGELLPPGPIGEVVIRGENVMKGYENNPQANEKAFTNGWFHTGDQGYLDEDGYLFLTGRLKELINRGGQKVSPREIDEVLLTHSLVGQAVAFAIPHQRLGEAVGAAVVLKEGAAVSEQELRHFAAEQLVSYKVPQQIVFLDEIPKGATGKLQRNGLAEKLSHLLETGYVAPRDEGETQLAKIWSEVLGVERIGVHDNFFALGGDSLLGTQVVSRVVEKYQIDLPMQTLFRHPILEDFSKIVFQYQEQKDQTLDMDTLTEVLSQVEDLSDEDAEWLLKDNK